jgi:hypothetical protein
MRDSIRAGDTVVIENNGTCRLGERELAFFERLLTVKAHVMR